MDSNNKNCKGVLFIKLILLNVEDKEQTWIREGYIDKKIIAKLYKGFI